MFVVQEQDTIMVFNRQGRMMYKAYKVFQVKKLSSESLVVITDVSVDFISEVEEKGRHDITVVTDTNFLLALATEDLVFVQRRVLIPIIDVYNSDFINVLRLYQNSNGEWIYFVIKFGIPIKTVVPTHLKGKIMYGAKNGKTYSVDLETNECKIAKLPHNPGINLQESIRRFNAEVKA